jgi:tRNA threonylcarbamoyladenosine biosynthesis protein TsaE
MGMITTAGVDHTRELGAALAPLARAGDLLLLTGEMGTGKTAFAQGFARGLGVTEIVNSPTFTLVHQHEGRLPLYHLDVYRLDHLNEVLDLGLAELLDGGGVTLIEWGDVVRPALPADYLEVVLAFGDTDDDRTVDVRVVGPAWSARHKAVLRALEPWTRLPGTGG